ncbi:restriction endonuclease subunit S [Exiguobacterium sp. s56]|uniref:restriction endonuclease subunit S n=1 Tax=Exiguobacterium sp. s56 TaxID=2751232 RepID=UPI001BE957D7|nr:restriction endonuclease subunit S [Exiguobacterium sp. s56]
MKNNIPAIRFPEFTLGWKSTTLNKVTNIIGGGTPDTKEPTYWDGEIDWYSPSEIGKKIYADGSVRKITQLGLEKSSAKILPANKTILFTSRAGIGDTAILKKDGATNQGFQSLVVHDNCDVYFLYSMNNKIKSYALKNASGSTFLEISGKNLGVMPMLIPSPEEQTKIGTFFKSLDDTISLHQQELEALNQTKQGFLQKMFPRAGESIPEFRFPGFKKEWTNYKIADISKVTMGQSPSGKNYTSNPNDHILVQGNADIKKGYVHPRVWTTQVTKTANPGDIILCVRAPVGDVAKTSHEVVLGRGVASLEGDEFLYHLLYKMKSEGYWTRFSTGSTFESINSTDIKDAVVMIPSKDEQLKIGEFFRQLDEVMELKEKEIEALKETKKGFLQKMFV